MDDVRVAADKWACRVYTTGWKDRAYLNEVESFLAGAAWQREQDANLCEAHGHADYAATFARLIREPANQDCDCTGTGYRHPIGKGPACASECKDCAAAQARTGRFQQCPDHWDDEQTPQECCQVCKGSRQVFVDLLGKLMPCPECSNLCPICDGEGDNHSKRCRKLAREHQEGEAK